MVLAYAPCRRNVASVASKILNTAKAERPSIARTELLELRRQLAYGPSDTFEEERFEALEMAITELDSSLPERVDAATFLLRQISLAHS